MSKVYSDYQDNLSRMVRQIDLEKMRGFADDLWEVWKHRRQFFICGNGGSGANAIHLANDFLYGVGKHTGLGMRVSARSANSSVITCLANDISYEHIFSQQLAVQGSSGDLLLVLSGSGNSPNIVRALQQARSMQIKTYAVLGYSGGKSLGLADVALHFPIDDMQVSEDLQTVVGHMLMQELSQRSMAR